MKKILTSYSLSIPLFVLALICYGQASNPNFLVNADTIGSDANITATILIVSGTIFLIGSIISIIFNIISKIKR